ncbi:unnamed protein product [Paramecium sonneborni]|uniref:Uncharacterized protein n=1 Tax=Paramecium sonneborni TaxID=65129 RepID=A0A8S1NBN4_9CILI|nr:unnamed protein product [Paramecium sonneborni]
MEINRKDVIKKWIQQILRRVIKGKWNYLNFVDSKQNLRKDLIDGKWDQILNQIKLFNFSGETLLDLYELIVQELVEVNETQSANQFFLQMIVPSLQEFKERLLRLDYLIRKPDRLSMNEIYSDNLSKEQRRSKVAQKVINECIEAPQCRLLELIGDSLRHLNANKIIINNKYDLFMGLGNQEQKVTQIGRIEKVIKYSEKMRVNSATFTPDGQNLITGSIDGIIEVWDPIKYQVRNDIEYQVNDQYMMHNNCIINLNANNELLVSLDNNGQLKVWKLKTGKCLKIVESPNPKQIGSVLLGKDPQQVFIASDYIQLFALKSGITQKQFRGHSGLIQSMFQSQEGSRLYTGALDQYFKVWDTHTGEQIYNLKFDTALEKIFYIQGSILICPRGKQIILLNGNFQELKRFHSESETELISCVAQGDFVYGLGQGSLYSYEIKSGKGLKLLKLPGENMQDICIGNNTIFFLKLKIFFKFYMSANQNNSSSYKSQLKVSLSQEKEEAQETLEIIHEMSQILNCGLDRQQLAVLVSMIENGVNPEALALVVNEMKTELNTYKKIHKP